MEISRWFCYIFFNCVVVQYLNAKTVSLNELIAAEEREKKNLLEVATLEDNSQPTKSKDRASRPISKKRITSTGTKSSRRPFKLPTSKLTDILERLPLVKRLGKLSNTRLGRLRQDRETLTRTLFGDRKISPLRYRKEFQIKSPLKPKKLKLAQNSRHKRKNQSIKREISGNDHLKRKYIPLLKSLGMLFDNLVEPDASELNEIRNKQYKRYRFDSGELFQEHNYRFTESRSQEETITTATSFSTETSSDTEDITTSENYDYSTIRPDTSVPILLSRNTLGSRRNNNGSSSRSRPSYNRNIKRNITRDLGTHEHNSGIRKNKTYAASNKNNTYSNTRDDTSSIGYTRTRPERDRYDTRNSTDRETVDYNTAEDENTTNVSRKDKFKTGGIEIESEKFIREPTRRLRGHIPESKNSHDEDAAESIQYEEIHEEGTLSTPNNSSSHKRITNKSSPITIKNEKIRSRNETVIFIHNDHPQTENYIESASRKTPVVLIFDGYSVTRDENGENKVSGKTIHIRS